MNISEIIKTRRSIFPKEFNGEVISDHIIENLLKDAHQAPSHKLTFPWHFRIYKGASKINLLDYFISQQSDLLKKEKLQSQKKQISHLILISARFSGILPEVEEICATACAVQNIYLSLHQYSNIGGYWSTGNNVLSDKFKKHMGFENNETCLGYFILGKVNEKRTQASRLTHESNVTWMQ